MILRRSNQQGLINSTVNLGQSPGSQHIFSMPAHTATAAPAESTDIQAGWTQLCVRFSSWSTLKCYLSSYLHFYYFPLCHFDLSIYPSYTAHTFPTPSLDAAFKRCSSVSHQDRNNPLAIVCAVLPSWGFTTLGKITDNIARTITALQVKLCIYVQKEGFCPVSVKHLCLELDWMAGFLPRFHHFLPLAG